MIKANKQRQATFVRTVHEEHGAAERICKRVSNIKCRGTFILCIASTETSDVPGVSAAGRTPELRRFTPTADAELLVRGSVKSPVEIPRSPAGVIAPVVITRACAKLLNWDISVVNCGVFCPPAIDFIPAGATVAKCVSTGKAQSMQDVQLLLEKGLFLGDAIDDKVGYLVIGECVPGGTTTAEAVISACGYKVDGLCSGSLPTVDYRLRSQLVKEGLERAKLHIDVVRQNPLLAIAALGDPMQPFVAGLLLSASKRMPVILAGGSQMVAVHSLAQALSKAFYHKAKLPNSAVFTTKWIISDPYADVKRLAQILHVPLVCSSPDFSRSTHEGLRAYERGHIKEGVGAGAAMALANLNGKYAESQILTAVEEMYLQLITPASL